MLAATLLLSGGASYAQGNKQEKKAKAYMVADAHLDTQWNWDVQTTIKRVCMEHDQPEPVSAEKVSELCIQL